MSPDLTPPKTFISYSWSSVDHESWVVNLASQLEESGVDAIFDKWDLRESNERLQESIAGCALHAKTKVF